LRAIYVVFFYSVSCYKAGKFCNSVRELPMANVRMVPPAAGATTTVNGRAYSAAAGSVKDVPDFDAGPLEANGWVRVSDGQVGATAARPVLTSARKDVGTQFHDTTLGYNIIWDGKVWRSPASGASV
jgi:hypothetical protein